MDTAAIIRAFGEAVIITRYKPGRYIERKWCDGGCSTFQVVASIQPMSGRERLLLPEGDRSREFVHIWTSSPLQLGDIEKKTRGDSFDWNGKTYFVEKVERWGNHYRSTASLENIGGGV